ncbi:MAG: L-seryl-tRNA(Sec) selenium transferase [Chloroflexota bacterium]
MSDLRSLPSVDKLLRTPSAEKLVAKFGRPLTLEAVRHILDLVRESFHTERVFPDDETLMQKTAHLLVSWTEATLYPLINASGVILHTNLGRAPLSRAAIEAIQSIAQGYSNLEYDVQKGLRGSRYVHAEELLTRLTGAEAALVVNNNAAAVTLILAALARRRRVLIARTQLVEIGGGFRVPEVMKQSGAILAEVGTTNRVHLSDYEQAISEQPIALVLHAHRSNFQIIGFTSEPSLSELVTLAHQAGLPLADDLGSGALLDTSRFGLGHEPMVQESIQAGADLVCFSGDKLLGGPQAGIILGHSSLVARLKSHPFARAIRPDKLCLAALSATLLHYLKDEAEKEIPIWKMIAKPPERLQEQAQRWASKLGMGEIVKGESTVGGGSLPGETLPTSLLALDVNHPDRFLSRLRQVQPPIIARLADDRVLLDPRTVLDEQEEALIAGLQRTLTGYR